MNAAQSVYLTQLDTKFRAYVSGFGGGKTFVGCLDLILAAARNPGLRQGYFAPTYRDIRDTFWPTCDEAATMLGFRTTVHQANAQVFIYRGNCCYGSIICRSMDKPGGIVGFKVARAQVDEIDTMPKDKAAASWNKIIARLRDVVPGVQNGVGVTTTPEGFRFVYDRFARDPKPDYSMVQASTLENVENLPDDYIQSLKDSYPDELISAYIMGQFVNLTSGTVYRNYDRVAVRSGEAIEDGDELHVGQDFNVGAMSSVVNVQRPDGWHVVGELTGVQDTPALIDTLREKWPAPRPIYVYPDASGKSRKTVDASKNDIELLRQAGLKVMAKDSNPRVKDRVLALNTAYSKGKLWVNDKAAPRFAEAQEQQAYDKNGEPDKTMGHDHLNDAQGYFASWRLPVVKPMHTRELRI